MNYIFMKQKQTQMPLYFKTICFYTEVRKIILLKYPGNRTYVTSRFSIEHSTKIAQWLWSQTAQVQILVPPLIRCVLWTSCLTSLCKLLHLQNCNDSTFLIKLLRLDELTHVKTLRIACHIKEQNKCKQYFLKIFLFCILDIQKNIFSNKIYLPPFFPKLLEQDFKNF